MLSRFGTDFDVCADTECLHSEELCDVAGLLLNLSHLELEPLQPFGQHGVGARLLLVRPHLGWLVRLDCLKRVEVL